MNGIRAIETHYRGYRFRSRTEARWAVFFDALGVRWEYERQGYDLPTGPYLPDFWLPDQGYWIEIKGTPPTEREEALCSELASATGSPVYLHVGNPEQMGWGTDWPDTASTFVGWSIDRWDNAQWWCECPFCDAVGIQFEGRAARLCSCEDGDKGYGFHTRRLTAAYAAARSARFEHGETP